MFRLTGSLENRVSWKKKGAKIIDNQIKHPLWILQQHNYKKQVKSFYDHASNSKLTC